MHGSDFSVLDTVTRLKQYNSSHNTGYAIGVRAIPDLLGKILSFCNRIRLSFSLSDLLYSKFIQKDVYKALKREELLLAVLY